MTMTKIQKHDFIEVSYSAKTEDGIIFDTTDEQTAKEQGLHRPNKTYGPLTLCVGEYQVVQGLDESFMEKDENSQYDITIEPEKAFGKKRADLIKLVPLKKFKEQGINPAVGLQVYVDNQVAVIKTVSGGRALVDFNHPLSGKKVTYSVEIKRKVTDTQKQLESLIKLQFPSAKVSITDDKTGTITLAQQMPDEYAKVFESQILKLIPSLKKIEFVSEKKPDEKPKNTQTTN